MLFDKLKDYGDSGFYPMHMPGHKRNKLFNPGGLPLHIDITEIPGFDDLHKADGILLETENIAVDLYGSKKAFMLVNGSTVGILAAIGALTVRGDKILATDNCHWSTPNAAKLFGLTPIYLKTKKDKTTGITCSIDPSKVKSALIKDPDIKIVAITSPSYEGVVSDIASISEIVHDAGALLLVDSAHGAHLGFCDYFPESAVKAGADVVVMSLHKTLPALTQCSLLHVCSDRADISAVKDLLYILQTSSPSYVLMASIDSCLRLLKNDSNKLFNDYTNNLTDFYNRIKNLNKLSILYTVQNIKNPEFYALDPGKIVVITKNAAMCGGASGDKTEGKTGEAFSNILREKYKIESERKFDDYVLLMTSICDTADGFNRLADALTQFDNLL